MFASIVLLTAALLGKEVAAHWAFDKLIFNGTVSKKWEYVRREHMPWYEGQNPESDRGDYFHRGSDIYSNDFTCGRNSTQYAPTTSTATVLSGSEVGFATNFFTKIARDGYPTSIFHPGPTQLFLSMAPEGTEMRDYKGNEPDARWFKIASFAQNPDNKTWAPLLKTELRFNIPKTTPPGSYLLRIESIYVDYEPGWPQFYVNCAQIEIVGPGGGTPSEFVKFPGAYEVDGPGILVPWEQWTLNTNLSNLTDYVAPGPPVWLG